MHVMQRVREELGLTQSEFGDAIGIKKATVSGIENGRNALTDQVIKAIRLAYNVNEEFLRTGDGEMFNPKADSALDRLCDEKNLSPAHRALVSAYLDLPPRARDLITEYIKASAAQIIRAEGQAQIDAARSAFEASARPVEGVVSEK